MKAITAEAIDLLKISPIGDWDVNAEISQREYQLGERLIYVQYLKGKSPRQYVDAAQCLVRDAWCDIDNAVSFAEALSKPLFPNFWDAHDRSGQPGARLDAYSIHFNYPDTRPIYCLSWNRLFQYTYTRYDEFDLWQDTPIQECLPAPPSDQFFVDVRRIGPGRFESVASPINQASSSSKPSV